MATHRARGRRRPIPPRVCAHAAKPIPSFFSLAVCLDGVLRCTRVLELCCCPSRFTRDRRLKQPNPALLLLSALHKDALSRPTQADASDDCVIVHIVTAFSDPSSPHQLLQTSFTRDASCLNAQAVESRGNAVRKDAAASPDVSFRPSVWSRAPAALPARRRRPKRPSSPPFNTQLQHLAETPALVEPSPPNLARTVDEKTPPRTRFTARFL